MDIIIYLYGLVGIITCIGYVPQTIKLIKAKSKTNEIALSTWGMWSITSTVTLIYAITVAQDKTFIFVSSVNVLGCLGIYILAMYNKHLRFRNVQYNRRSTDPKPVLEGCVQLPHETKDVAEQPSYMQQVEDHEFSEHPQH